MLSEQRLVEESQRKAAPMEVRHRYALHTYHGSWPRVGPLPYRAYRIYKGPAATFASPTEAIDLPRTPVDRSSLSSSAAHRPQLIALASGYMHAPHLLAVACECGGSESIVHRLRLGRVYLAGPVNYMASGM